MRHACHHLSIFHKSKVLRTSSPSCSSIAPWLTHTKPTIRPTEWLIVLLKDKVGMLYTMINSSQRRNEHAGVVERQSRPLGFWMDTYTNTARKRERSEVMNDRSIAATDPYGVGWRLPADRRLRSGNPAYLSPPRGSKLHITIVVRPSV